MITILRKFSQFDPSSRLDSHRLKFDLSDGMENSLQSPFRSSQSALSPSQGIAALIMPVPSPSRFSVGRRDEQTNSTSTGRKKDKKKSTSKSPAASPMRSEPMTLHG